MLAVSSVWNLCLDLFETSRIRNRAKVKVNLLLKAKHLSLGSRIRGPILVWESNERDAWKANAQRWIMRIKGVQQCRINLDDQGEIVEVLVVAGTDKAPRHIVRDVETLLKMRTDFEVDYKKISVTQLIDNNVEHEEGASEPVGPGVTFHDSDAYFEDGYEAQALLSPNFSGSGDHYPEDIPEDIQDDIPDDIPDDMYPAEDLDSSAEPLDPPLEMDAVPAVILAEEPSPRIVCANVGLMTSDMVVSAEVQLRAGDIESFGIEEGPNHAGSDILLVAQATVKALGELLVDPVLLHVKEVRLESLGSQTVVLTAIDLVEGRQTETLFGSCSARHNRQQAVVFSVLDAVNRRLNLYGLKSARSEG